MTSFRRLIEVKYLVVHHAASPVHWSFSRIRDIHLDKGWVDVGYHFGIEREGTLRYGRPLWAVGAHCPPWNQRSWGVCVIGDNTTPDEDAAEKWRQNNHQWTDDQLDTLRTLVTALRLAHPRIEVVGHYEVGSTPTVCPGMEGASLRSLLHDVL